MALPQPTGPLRRIVLESFLIAGWQDDPAMMSSTNSTRFTANGALCLNVQRRQRHFSCYEKLDHLHFGPLFSGNDAGFVQ